MRSIRGELLQVFLIVIGVLAAISVGYLLVHVYIVDQYKSVSETSIQEHQLMIVAADLTNDYNARYLSNDISTNDAAKQLLAAKTSISNITAYLDTAIVDPQSKGDYIGLKNTLSTLIGSIDDSLAQLSHNSISSYSNDHDKIIQQFSYVQDNATTLVFSQLTYANSIQGSLNRTYHLSEIVGISTLVLTTVACIVYVLRFARRLTEPLSQLTMVAGQIADGAIQTPIEQGLIGRKDEIGSLANSLYLMLQELKDKIG